MFVTTPDMEHWLPKGLASPGMRYWQAFTIESGLPWFLLTVGRRNGRAHRNQTVAIAWESTLQKIVRETAPEEVKAIYRVAPGAQAGTHWSLGDVVELWAVRDSSARDEHGLLLFGLKGHSGLIDSHGSPSMVDDAHRYRLFMAPKTEM